MRLRLIALLLVVLALGACESEIENETDDDLQDAAQALHSEFDGTTHTEEVSLPTTFEGFDVTYESSSSLFEEGTLDVPGYYEGDASAEVTFTMDGETSKTFTLELRTGDTLEHSRTISFRNIADEYELDARDVEIVYNEPHTVPYIELNDALELLDGGEKDGAIDLDALEIDRADGVITITNHVEGDEAEEEDPEAGYTPEDRTYTLVIDTQENTVEVNKFDFFNSFSTPPLTDFGQDLNVVDYSVDYSDGVTFDLDDYNMTIFDNEDGVYLPFHLANTFFSGQMYDIHYLGDEIIGYDGYSYTRAASAIRNSSRSEATIEERRRQYTYDYTAFVFDHFYGLKEDQGVDTYYDVFDKDDFMATGNTHYINLFNAIYGLDDMHTSMPLNGMYTTDELPGLTMNVLGERSQEFQGALTAVNQQGLCGSEVTVRTIDDGRVGVISIPGFDEDTGNDFADALDALEATVDDVVVDLSCNTGGVVGGMIQVLGHMSDEPIDLHTLNAADGTTSVTSYASDVEARTEYSWHLRTSGATYSAGNMMAQTFKDMELGTLIGEQSAGGASSIAPVALPNGAVIIISSPSVNTDENFNSTEFGVPVDTYVSVSEFSDDDSLLDAID